MSLRCIPSFLLLCLLFLPSPAQAQPVSVPPNLYTLDELAAKLSIPDAPVKASVTVARRLGFARLKERSQADALRQIEMAFALKANPRPAPEKGFLLVEDPEVMRRERRWMNHFVAIMQQQVMEATNDLSALVQLSPDQLVRERDKRYREQEAMIGKTKAGTLSGQTFIALYNRYMRAASAAHNQESLAKRLDHVSTKQVPLLVDEAVRHTFFLRGEVFSDGNETNAGNSTAFIVTHATLRHTRANYDFKLWVDVLSLDNKDEFEITETYGGNLTSYLFGSVTPNTPDSFAPALGKDAADWIASERAVTEKFLATEPAWKEFKLNPALPSDAMSSRVWQWCMALDREAVIEVFPTMDASEAQADSLAHVFQRYDYWSGRDENGVVIITNRLAFLDRARPWNFPALQCLVQSQVKTAKPSSPATSGIPIANSDVFPLSLLAPFTERAWNGKNYVAWGWPGIATSRNYYYHYEPGTLDGAAAIGLLWAQLPMQYQNVPTKRTEFALNTFSAATLRLLAQWFESTGTVAARHPGFLEHFRKSGRLILEPGRNPQILIATVVFDDPTAPLNPRKYPRLLLAMDL